MPAGDGLAGVEPRWGGPWHTWEMSTPYGDDPLHTVNAHAVAEDMTQATGGALTITVHSGGSLIRHARIKPAVDNGRVPIGEVLMSQRGNVDALFEVDAIPFLATDYGQARQLWAASWPILQARLEAQGLQLLYAVPRPPRGSMRAGNCGRSRIWPD